MFNSKSWPILIFIFLNLILNSISFSKSTSEVGDLKYYKDQLAKIEESISLTREKISAPQSTQYLPDMYYMLAELLAEKGTYLYIIKKESNKGVPDSELDFTAEKRAKTEAIEAFKQLEQRYPTYKSMDKVLYVIGHELKSLSEMDQALQYFKKSAELFPNSLFAPKSYLEIGNIFYEKKDFDFAVEQYLKASKQAQGEDLLSVYNKMASCYSFKGSWKNAFEQYLLVIKKEINLTKEIADQKEEALIQSVWPLLELQPLEFPNLKKASNIISFYKKASFDTQSYRKALERLSKRFEFKKRNDDAQEVALELFRISKDSREKKEWFEAYFNLTREKLNYEYPFWITKELSAMIVTGVTIGNDILNEKETLKYEEAFRFIITKQHKSAMANKRIDDLLQTLEGYERYLSIYSKGNNFIAMLKNKSELEFLSGKYIDAALDYYTVSKLSSNQPKESKDYLISSLDASLKAMSEKNDRLLNQVRSRVMYRKVGSYFKKNFPNDPKIAEIDFNRAKAYYDEQKLDLAAKQFIRFVQKYPKSEQAESASVLALDCYYLQNKLEKMSKIGQILLSVNDLSSQIKSQISSSIQQAQLKNVRSIAGDFTSKNYAAKFVEFAKKNKDSAMGEQALYEAFLSLKAASKEKALDIGEEYMATYGNNSRAKEVLLQMSQLSLVFLDFVKAASYMATFGQKFSNDPSSNALLEQAALLYAMSGKTNESFIIYKMLGQPERGAKVLSQWAQWSALESQASQISGLSGIYFQALAQIRQGKLQSGIPLMKRVLSISPNSEEEKDKWSHAHIIVMEDAISQFKQATQVTPFTTQVLQSILEQQQLVSSIAQNVVSNGSGIWKLAALALDSSTNEQLAHFLKSTPPPSGFSPDQFKKVVGPQVTQLESNASNGFTMCAQVAEENELASGYVSSCRERKPWSEKTESFSMQGSRQIASLSKSPLKEKLMTNPRSSQLIKEFAVTTMESKDEPTALLLLTRARDLDPSSADVESLMSLAWYRMGAFANSMSSVKEALSKDPQDSLALSIKRELFKKFGYKKKLAELNSLKGVKKNPYIRLISN